MQTNRFELSGYLAAKPAARSLPSGTLVGETSPGELERRGDNLDILSALVSSLPRR